MRSQRGVVIGAALTSLLLLAIIGTVWWRGWESVPAAPLAYAPAAFTAGLVLLAAFVLPLFVRPFALRARPALPWVIGLAAALPALIGYLLTVMDRLPFALLLYQGLHIPTWDWMPRFFDLTLVLQSIDCSALGFDVYAAGNGCLEQPAIYGPGQLWLQFVPLGVFTAANAAVLGVLGIVVSALALVWLARQSSGRGQLALLAASLGAAWILLVERGNIDAVVIWTAVVVVILVRRYDTWWMWSIAAGLIWLMGTWKYYPFVMGLMLIPVLRLRHGWAVIAGFLTASVAYLILSWDTFAFSTQANTGMAQIEDLVALGRSGVVARMLAAGAVVPGYQGADFVVIALAAAAILWGATFVGGRAHGRADARLHDGMLAAAGGSLLLTTIVVSGFGYAYKAAFLLLAVPLVGKAALGRTAAWYSSTVVLILIAISSIVVWNTLLATTAAIVAGGFALGAGAAVLVRAEVDHLRVLRKREVVDDAGLARG